MTVKKQPKIAPHNCTQQDYLVLNKIILDFHITKRINWENGFR